MNTRAPQARLLRLVPPPTSTIDADLVAFTIMEFIDKNFPAMFSGSTIKTRVSLRNAIVQAVLAKDANR